MVNETATSEVLTRSTDVSCLWKTAKIDDKNPYAINIRADWILMTVIPFLEAIDFTVAFVFGGFPTMRVPVDRGRLELRTTTGMFFSTAGWIVLGCRTLAPK